MTDQHTFETLRKLLEQAGSSGSVELPTGGHLDVQGQPEQGILARMSAGDMRIVQFAPSAEPHAEYPDDLPFVPDAAVAVSHLEDGRRTVHWWQPGEHVLDHLLSAAVADGWTVGESRELEIPGAAPDAATWPGTGTGSAETPGLSGLPGMPRMPGAPEMPAPREMGSLRQVTIERDGRRRTILGSALVVILMEE